MKKLLFLTMMCIFAHTHATLHVSGNLLLFERSRTPIIKTNKGFKPLTKGIGFDFSTIDELPNSTLVFGYDQDNLYQIGKDVLLPLFKRNAVLALTSIDKTRDDQLYPAPLIFKLVTDKNKSDFLGEKGQIIEERTVGNKKYWLKFPPQQSEFIEPEKVTTK